MPGMVVVAPGEPGTPVVSTALTGVKARQTAAFIGGEDLQVHSEMRLSGTGFYRTIEEFGILKVIYRLAEEKAFDVYEVGTRTVLGFNRVLKYLHNGVLPTYMIWCLLGMIGMFLAIFLR